MLLLTQLIDPKTKILIININKAAKLKKKQKIVRRRRKSGIIAKKSLTNTKEI